MQLLGTLRFAQRAGFTVAEIRALFHGFGREIPPAERWRVLAERKMAQVVNIPDQDEAALLTTFRQMDEDDESENPHRRKHEHCVTA